MSALAPIGSAIKRGANAHPASQFRIHIKNCNVPRFDQRNERMAEIGLRNTPRLAIATAIDIDRLVASSIFLGIAEGIGSRAPRRPPNHHISFQGRGVQREHGDALRVELRSSAAGRWHRTLSGERRVRMRAAACPFGNAPRVYVALVPLIANVQSSGRRLQTARCVDAGAKHKGLAEREHPFRTRVIANRSAPLTGRRTCQFPVLLRVFSTMRLTARRARDLRPELQSMAGKTGLSAGIFL